LKKQYYASIMLVGLAIRKVLLEVYFVKIGRNDRCPCGSGKKYKKCCLRKDFSNIAPDTSGALGAQPTDFPYITSNALSLNKIIRKYVFEDVIIAAFCLNLWRRNRSALEQSLTLNLSITMGGSFGHNSIKSFEELCSFYDDISGILTVSGHEDHIIDDYGEVFISHEGKSYPVIIGTGYQQVYGALRYLQALSKVCNRQDELTDLLEYSSGILAFTRAVNTPNTNSEIIYELPTPEFWSCTTSLFDSPVFSKQVEFASNIVGHQDGPIEMRHFVERDGRFFPLFNTSILLDYYKFLLNTATDEEKKRHITIAIHSLLENSFNISPNTPNRVLIQPIAVNGETNARIDSKALIFAGFAEDILIIGIDNAYKNVEGTISAINELKTENNLRLVEPHYRPECGGSYAVAVKSDIEVIYILVDPFTDILSHTLRSEGKSKHFQCTALDIFYLIGFAEDFGEIAAFVRYYSALKTKIFTFGGKNNIFFSWKNAHREIAAGAVEYDLLATDFNTTEDYVFSHFSENLKEFPRTGTGLFVDPLHWQVKDAPLGYKQVFHKGCPGFGGEVKMLSGDTSVFLAHNVDFFTKDDFTQNGETQIRTIDEINQRLFVRYADRLSQIQVLKGRTLQLLFMPWHYAQQHHKTTFLSDSTRTLVYSDEYFDGESLIIRYSVDPDVLIESIRTAPDRRAENTYFAELLQPLEKYDPNAYKDLLGKLKEDSALKKTVGVSLIEQQYYFSNMAIDTNISAVDFTKARKEIAQMCHASGIEPGEYRGKAATEVVRKMQAAIVCAFENHLSDIDMLDLHKQALNYYAFQQNGIVLNMKRYHAFTDLDKAIQMEFEKQTRQIRERYRSSVETAKYLLESNLFVKHKDGAKKCTKSNFSFLLAFADWLVVLQNNSDTSRHTEFDITISVDTDYRVDTILSDESLERAAEMVLRKYNTTDYQIKTDSDDKAFFERAINAFQEDTGIDLKLMLSLADYLQLGVIENQIAEEIYPNVFAVDESVLAHKYNEVLDQPVLDIDIIHRIIEFLTVKPELLKTTGGAQHDYLPIWEREKRDNRFDTKPIVRVDNMCIFSPIALNNVLSLWRNGLANWFPPYEIGLPKLTAVLKKWKKRYEDEMVQDIAQLFRDAKFDVVIPELELIHRFPADNYPEELGDYDVFAINHTSREIWIVEAKVLQKNGSIYEDQMQQKNFFVQKKYDERFQRRIDYLTNHYTKVLTSMKLDTLEYRIVPYMVTNKLFVSRYKKINFPIITYHELHKKLCEAFGRDRTAEN